MMNPWRPGALLLLFLLLLLLLLQWARHYRSRPPMQWHPGEA